MECQRAACRTQIDWWEHYDEYALVGEYFHCDQPGCHTQSTNPDPWDWCHACQWSCPACAAGRQFLWCEECTANFCSACPAHQEQHAAHVIVDQ